MAESTDQVSTRLERAALRLLERNGVLAGLNLREVAAEADAARGLVYHHFGSRRGLLRAALENAIGRRRSAFVRRSKLPAPERLRDFFRRTVRDPSDVRLLTLLLLDGDEGVRALPFAVETTEAYQRDQEASRIADDLDAAAMQAGLISSVYGWALFRKSFASSLGRRPEDLDADVLTMIERSWAPRPTE